MTAIPTPPGIGASRAGADQPLCKMLPPGFLSDVLTAAGLVRHGKRCAALADRLGDAYVQITRDGVNEGGYPQSLLCGSHISELPKGDAVIAGVGHVDQEISSATPGADEKGAVSVNLRLHSPEHDLKPAVPALPHGAPPARDDYVRAAKIIALAYGRHHDAPAYLPRTEDEAARFEPHAWVVLAMMQAYADGQALADGRIAAVPELLACIRDLVGQITAFAEQHGEADFETGRATRLLTQLGAERVSAADELRAA